MKGNYELLVGVLDTVDQLIIDKSILKGVKTYHRNLTAAFFDYKKAYDKLHHDWMLRVYKWIGVLDNVITLLSSGWRSRKTGKKVSGDGLI